MSLDWKHLFLRPHLYQILNQYDCYYSPFNFHQNCIHQFYSMLLHNLNMIIFTHHYQRTSFQLLSFSFIILQFFVHFGHWNAVLVLHHFIALQEVDLTCFYLNVCYDYLCYNLARTLFDFDFSFHFVDFVHLNFFCHVRIIHVLIFQKSELNPSFNIIYDFAATG